ncbi:ABC transporter ATP-binding protein [Amycolatopsis sp. CA-230715]|uniref:ABC transporter ATP-binding protein n=1 Tax=Amycolatopsis sp. CA-230715 TaxID=2745196 RepID=UPI001C02519B|nr:ABC transporter ATP-binding protein [Amycolatopsis sp. CA-230715]QWF81512.1 Bacitracin export ATP-binding protein BceA [Amycolatopsis sp. CA-230715]
MTRTSYLEQSPRGTAAQRGVVVRDLVKVYGAGDNAVTVLDGVTFAFRHRSVTAVMGPSGSGKSTLLHCAAGLDRPTSGSVSIDGTELTTVDEAALTRLRRDRLGFVFQSYNLVPTLTVRQNVTLPAELAGRRVAESAVEGVLARLGLGAHTDVRPASLSGGQQQRVAIARALLAEPAVIFADEPTGALDSRAAAEVLGLLRDAVDAAGRTIVMVTHDPVAASIADAVVFFADGRVVDTLTRPTADAVAARMARLGAPVGGVR